MLYVLFQGINWKCMDCGCGCPQYYIKEGLFSDVLNFTQNQTYKVKWLIYTDYADYLGSLRKILQVVGRLHS